ncbi:MAG: hypothetical protein U0354_16215 [Candidatus Sericytochromatia bacterium]
MTSIKIGQSSYNVSPEFAKKVAQFSEDKKIDQNEIKFLQDNISNITPKDEDSISKFQDGEALKMISFLSEGERNTAITVSSDEGNATAVIQAKNAPKTAPLQTLPVSSDSTKPVVYAAGGKAEVTQIGDKRVLELSAALAAKFNISDGLAAQISAAFYHNSDKEITQFAIQAGIGDPDTLNKLMEFLKSSNPSTTPPATSPKK